MKDHLYCANAYFALGLIQNEQLSELASSSFPKCVYELSVKPQEAYLVPYLLSVMKYKVQILHFILEEMPYSALDR